MLEEMLELFANYKKTCSITKPRSGCVTFARDESYIKYLYLTSTKKDMWVIVPWDMSTPSSSTGHIKYYHSKYPEYEFTLFHNHINKKNKFKIASIGFDCKLHETVLVGVEGLKVVNAPNGTKVPFTHTGRAIIEDNVDIGPYSVIHRGTMENTIIREGCKFGAYTNIGHNCDIGRRTVMAAGVILNGGVKVGKNCWFGSGSVIKHYTTITDNVVIGHGAVVTKDINESGVYVGNPARFLKPIEEGWNF